jgi:hypothetical protein
MESNQEERKMNMRYQHMMKGFTVLALGMMTAITASAQTLYLHYDFNVPPNTTAGSNIVDLSNSGFDGVHTNASGTRALGSNVGVTGANGDYALEATDTADSAVVVPQAVFELPDQLPSVTFTFWFKGDLYNGTLASRVFEYSRADIQQSLIHTMSDAGGYDNFKLKLGYGADIMSTGTVYNANDKWIFVAITYDSVVEEKATFWVGTQTSAVEVVNTVSDDYTWSPGLAGGTGVKSFRLGNTSYAWNRGMTAMLDDFRLYGSTSTTTGEGALTEDQLNAIRLEGVPEPVLYLHYDFNVPPNDNNDSNIVDRSDSGWDGILRTSAAGKNLGTTPGVSGEPWDYALAPTDADESTVFIPDTVFDPPESLPSITCSFWFKGALEHADRIWEYVRDDLQYSIFFVLKDGTTDNNAIFRCNLGSAGNSNMESTGTAYNASSEWIFAACTFDSIEGVTTYWKGTGTEAVHPVTVIDGVSTAWAPGAGGGPEPGDWSFRVANRPYNWDRGLGAALDEFRLYGSTSVNVGVGALSQEQLEAIREATRPRLGTLIMLR